MALPFQNPEVRNSSERRRYKNPPVVEAVIDIKVRSERPPTFEALASINGGEEATYPSRHSVSTGQFTFEIANGQSSASQQLVGYRFSTAANDMVFQAHIDGFSFSRLTPYRDWELWQPEARRIWDRYRAVVEPIEITRIAVRYVNRVLLNREKFRPSEYFHCFPALPESFGPTSAFVMRVEIPQPSLGDGMLVLSQGILADPSPVTMSVLLDLDLFRSVKLQANDPSLWTQIEELHLRENELFEDSITERTRGIFDAVDD